MSRVVFGVSAFALLAASAPAAARDADAGRAVFRAQCLLCHTAEPGDAGGAQGPSLHGVFGRAAGSAPGWTYTAALKDSGLTWDEATLVGFLANPMATVPGTAMVIPVAAEADRENLAAYFASVADAGDAEAGAATTAASQDWRGDAPGVVHRIDPAALPAPYATEAARNMPQVGEKPADAQLHVPEGFSVSVFAEGLEGPRRMLQTPDGDVLLTEPRGGRIKLLHVADDGAAVESVSVFAEGMAQPYGMAFYPAENPEWLYVAQTDKVVRFPYSTGDAVAAGAPEVVVASIPSGGHSSRDIAFSEDGSRFFVSVGSASNVGENLEAMSPEAALAFDQQTGLGAAWGPELNRAAVLAFETDGDGTPSIYATGLRNCVRLLRQPGTDTLWCTVNERDQLGDDLVPDYSTRVQEGGFYGWPWYYFGNNEDPRRAGERPDLAGKAIVPDVPYQAHSASVGMAFYEPNDGASAFPEEYFGDGFAVFHGSWNRSGRTGHKVVRVLMEDGVPTGAYEDFLTGFILDDGQAWARPADVTVLADGSMLLSEDGHHTIYRITYGE